MKQRKHPKTGRPVLVLVIIILLGVLLAVFVSDRHFQTPPKAVLTSIQEEASLSMAGIRMTSTREGTKAYDLTAVSGRYLDNHQKAVFDQIAVVFYQQEGQPVSLTADKGLYQSNSSDLEVSGNVVVENDPYRMETAHLQYADKPGALVSDTPVSITGATIKLTSESMSYNFKTREITLKGKVSGIISENIKL